MYFERGGGGTFIYLFNISEFVFIVAVFINKNNEPQRICFKSEKRPYTTQVSYNCLIHFVKKVRCLIKAYPNLQLYYFMADVF